MRRRLFAAASAVSLLLCVGTVTLWVRSKTVEDYLNLKQGGAFVSVGGRVRYLSETIIDADGSGHPRAGWFSSPIDSSIVFLRFEGEKHWTLFGVDVWRGDYGKPRYSHFEEELQTQKSSPNWGFQLPYALIVGFQAVLPISWLVRRLSAKTRGRNACYHCGYSLTGNTSGICPECGRQVAEKVGAKA